MLRNHCPVGFKSCLPDLRSTLTSLELSRASGSAFLSSDARGDTRGTTSIAYIAFCPFPSLPRPPPVWAAAPNDANASGNEHCAVRTLQGETGEGVHSPPSRLLSGTRRGSCFRAFSS